MAVDACGRRGVLLFTLSEGDKTKAIGRIVIGFGLMLLSLIHLKSAAAPLEDSPLFSSLLGGLAGEPFLGFFVAVALTWLMHSSLTIVLFVMALAAANALPMPLAFALVLGANVGGAIAPLTALVGSPPAGRRVALGNLVMRLAVALPFLFLLAPSLALLKTFTTSPGHLVLNFHTGVQHPGVADIPALRRAGRQARACASCRTRWRPPTAPSRAISTRPCSTRPPRRSAARCARHCTWATASPTCCGRRSSCSRSPIRSS